MNYGIISRKDADIQIVMNLENYIKEQFQQYDVDLKINYLESNNMYRVRVPKKLQDAYNLKAQYFGASEKNVLQKIFDIMYTDRKSKATIKEVFDAWHLERVSDPDVSSNTNYKDQLGYDTWIAGTKIESIPMRNITIDDLNALFKSITKDRNVTKSRFNNFKSSLNLLWDYAVGDYRACDHNIARELKGTRYKFKPSKNSVSDVYTTEEINRLWRYMMEKNTVYSLACALAFCLGCRIGEIKALRWSDVDFNKRIISIRSEVVAVGYSNDQKLKAQTKSGLTEGNREIPFFNDGYDTLMRIKDLHCDKDFLFLGKTGKFILTQEINANIKSACDALGIAYYSSHKIRKWAATEAIRQGMDEVTLMYSFGWKDRQTVQHYVKAGRTSQTQMAVLSKVFDKSAT